MKILRFRGKSPNFGDELNTWLWPKLLPNFFDEDPSTLFIGIGSTIGDAAAQASRKIVCGAGFVPYYHKTPDMRTGEWDVSFVRGPRTAARLGLAPELAIGDAGILLRTQVSRSNKTVSGRVSFMPHWETMECGQWSDVCRAAGVQLIDPRAPVVKIINDIQNSDMLIAEAMHGAIAADALRVPWIPVMPMNAVHRDKWYDWAESLDITLKPQRLWPIRIADMNIDAFFTKAMSDRTLSAPVPRSHKPPSLMARAKRGFEATPLASMANRMLFDVAVHRLKQMAKSPPTLSRDDTLNETTDRMLTKLEEIRRNYAA